MMMRLLLLLYRNGIKANEDAEISNDGVGVVDAYYDAHTFVHKLLLSFSPGNELIKGTCRFASLDY